MHGAVFNGGSANDKGCGAGGWVVVEMEGERIRATFSPRWLGYLTILLLYRLNGQIYIHEKWKSKVSEKREDCRLHVAKRRKRSRVEILWKCKKKQEGDERGTEAKREKWGTWGELEREILQTQANRQYMCIHASVTSRTGNRCSMLDQLFQRRHRWLDAVKWHRNAWTLSTRWQSKTVTILSPD